WIDLGRRIESRAMRCWLPWGGEDERRRSERIAAGLARAVVPGAMALDRLAGLLRGARAVAGVDTGLTHLAAALARPVAAIYCATDPRLTGVVGGPATRNVGGPGHVPSAEEVWEALADVGAV